jgi:hypothetical protein
MQQVLTKFCVRQNQVLVYIQPMYVHVPVLSSLNTYVRNFFLSIGMQKKIKATGTKVAINKTA